MSKSRIEREHRELSQYPDGLVSRLGSGRDLLRRMPGDEEGELSCGASHACSGMLVFGARYASPLRRAD